MNLSARPVAAANPGSFFKYCGVQYYNRAPGLYKIQPKGGNLIFHKGENQMKNALVIILSGSFLLLTACSSMSTLPKEDNVKVSRDEPKKECKYLSKLEGRSANIKGTAEDALKDLKQEAANKGANYLVVRQYSDLGTSVTGEAYACP